MKKFSFIKNTMMASAIAISTLASPLAALTDEEIKAAVQGTFSNASEAAEAIREFTTDQWNMLKGHLEGYYNGNVAIPHTDVRIHAAQIAAGLDSKYWNTLFRKFYTISRYDFPQYITDGKLQSWIPEILSTLEEKDWDTFFRSLDSFYRTDHSEIFKFLSGKKISCKNWSHYILAANRLIHFPGSAKDVTSSEALPIIQGLLGETPADETSFSPLVKRGISAFQKDTPANWGELDSRVRDLLPDFKGRLSSELYAQGINASEVERTAYIALVERVAGTEDSETDFVESIDGRHFLNSEKFSATITEEVKRFRGLVSRPSASAAEEE